MIRHDSSYRLHIDTVSSKYSGGILLWGVEVLGMDFEVIKIADAKEDREHWLDVRQDYLTSSEFFTWREEFTKETDWWPDRRKDVLFVKAGGEKTFTDEAVTSMLHGSEDEENILRKFGKAAGCVVSPQNGLYTNSRWPALAASIDCIGYAGLGLEPVPEFSHDRDLFPYLHEVIWDWNEPFIIEAKKSTSTKWQTKCPDYYWTQCQAQMHILDIPRNIITAECVKKGDTEKWRKYWDQRAYVIDFDHSFAVVMDQLNQEAIDLIRRNES